VSLDDILREISKAKEGLERTSKCLELHSWWERRLKRFKKLLEEKCDEGD